MNQARPRLSVVIPVRNGMPFIETALASVLESGVDDLEVLVMENHSTDGTPEWLATISDPRVRVVPADEPVSAAGNWTRACEAAQANWVKLLCADDFVTEGGLARQLDAAQAHPDAALVASRRRVVSDDGRTIIGKHGLSGLIGHRPGADAIRHAMLSGANPFGEPSSVMFRRDALLASLPFSEEHPYLTDLDMYMKVLEKGDFLGLATVDGGFRVSTTSWSASIGRDQLQQHRTWLATLHGRSTLGVFERFRSDAKLYVRFLARRAVTAFLGARSRKPLLAISPIEE